MNKPELKACPFCGKTAYISHDKIMGDPFVTCGDWDCGGLTRTFETEEMAAAAWNKRAVDEEHQNYYERVQFWKSDLDSCLKMMIQIYYEYPALENNKHLGKWLQKMQTLLQSEYNEY